MKIINAVCKELKWQNPVNLFEQYHNYNYSVLLTGNGKKDISRFSFIGVFPHTVIRYENNHFYNITESENIEFEGKFWSVLKDLFLIDINYEFPIKLCGWIGYFSYEMLHKIEYVHKFGKDNYQFPILETVFYNTYFIFDHYYQKLYKIDFDFEKKSLIMKKKQYQKKFIFSKINTENTKESYLEKVCKIKEYILNGDVYEVNFTQQTVFWQSGDPFDFFKNIFKKNPAPFSAFLNFNNKHILSNSPEMFLRCEGKNVETRPIKGTIKREKNVIDNKKNKFKLLNSLKDQAELFMITDLMRNDLNKVCEIGSVQVVHKKRIETYENVFHLISIIKGRIKNEFDYIDLIKATFPGGSITGCPKIRCMEIIEELEKYHRQLYTGSIFIMNKNNLISNIVIRTAILKGEKMYLNSGGAITIDSNPEEEYQESVYKLQNWFDEL